MEEYKFFEKIVPYLNNPFSLTGFVLFLFFGIHKILINSGVIPTLSKREGSKAIQVLLRYGFIIAIITILAGFFYAGLQNVFDVKRLEKKINEARQLVDSEVLANISNIDNRLGYVKEALEPDDFAKELNKVREKIAPSIKKQFATGYNQLIAEQQITSLRQAMNSSPLRIEFGQSLIQNLKESGIDPVKVNKFYDQLAEVQRATESLFDTLSYVASTSVQDDKKQSDYNNRRINLAFNILKNRSVIAYVQGLQILKDLKDNYKYIPDNAINKLKLLKNLEPIQLINDAQANTLLDRLVDQSEKFGLEKAALLEEGKQLRNAKLEQYKEINELLKIKSTDSWSEVVGKAISLRQLGRITEAVAAFSRYGEMFSKTDPTAYHYSTIAQKFTIQLGMLSLEGGIYIYHIDKGSKARQAGLKVGDILVSYWEKDISNMNDFVSALKNAPRSDSIEITYLRMDKNGRFYKKVTTIPKGDLGAGFMPI
ncbi:MAG: PDZ domain-containing protein [Deltaproteobacteria bacterium]|nr:PDZ domain-containing protein [Deltaproteobacteria bacterium]